MSESNVIPLANAAQRVLSRIFPGFFDAIKHDHYADFGFPTDLTFKQLYDMYLRNGIARAAVMKTKQKTWQENPFLLEKERDGSEGADTEETVLEKEIRIRFDQLRLWQKFAEADMRMLVGGWSGIILRVADSKPFNAPVDRVGGGLDGLVEVIPAWAGQLTVAEWDTDELSPFYGSPKMFQFNEANVETGQTNHRQFQVHPDRVIVWSPDATVHNRSMLEPGFNDLMTMEKVVGAGGEGFWKNAKSAPVLEMDKDLQLNLPRGMTPQQFADATSEQVEAWNQGFDKMLMLKGIQAKTLNVTLPQPEEFFNIALQSFAASISIPLKILVGNQTGERASTEDAEEWAQTNMSRRANLAVPNILLFVERLVRFGILAEKDWFVDWSDLTEASMGEKIERASKMADVNQKTGTTEWVFTPEEIRKAVGYEPLAEGQAERDETTEDEQIDALGGSTPVDAPAPNQR
jgi:hypothetical protein